MIRKKRTDKQFIQEEEIQKTAASSLNRIYKKVEESGLSEKALEELDGDINLVRGKFSISQKGAILLGCVTEATCSMQESCDDDGITNYLGCTNIEFISFQDALQEMLDLDIIEGSASRYGHNTYRLTPEARNAIEKDTEFVPQKKTGLTNEELFTRIAHVFYNYKRGAISAEYLLGAIQSLVKKNRQLFFCREVIGRKILDECPSLEQRMFFFLCHMYVKEGTTSVPVRVLLNFAEYFEDDHQFKRDVNLEKTYLQTKKLAQMESSDGFADESELSLSDKVKNTFFEEIEIASCQINHRNIISCDSIPEQELFYNEEENKQIDSLAQILEQENFAKVQSRLKEEGMPTGLSCVFHGSPGSGKTASLKALAKRTGRDIFWVDLSTIKSKWVGESEKNMKALFKSYHNLAKTSEKTPILAVNEADAIFTKRITNVEHSVDNMYNAMTDIVLNELETLDGILIATTNLVGNMCDDKDNAMERRFLFKVEFNTPSEEVRERIWKSKMKYLSDEEASILARRFSFSGGNIENVSRKATVGYVLSGERPSIDTIISYCEKENFSRKERRKIGFGA